eukprot:763758-Hanusia_phi.AAC.2
MELMEPLTVSLYPRSPLIGTIATLMACRSREETAPTRQQSNTILLPSSTSLLPSLTAVSSCAKWAFLWGDPLRSTGSRPAEVSVLRQDKLDSERLWETVLLVERRAPGKTLHG